jgi:hypothetical protein
VAARLKAWVCGRALAGIVGSNPTGAWILFSCECMSVEYLRRADPSSRRVLPTAVCVCMYLVITNNLDTYCEYVEEVRTATRKRNLILTN